MPLFPTGILHWFYYPNQTTLSLSIKLRLVSIIPSPGLVYEYEPSFYHKEYSILPQSAPFILVIWIFKRFLHHPSSTTSAIIQSCCTVVWRKTKHFHYSLSYTTIRLSSCLKYFLLFFSFRLQGLPQCINLSPYSFGVRLPQSHPSQPCLPLMHP